MLRVSLSKNGIASIPLRERANPDGVSTWA
jgi:hypothetical protein